MRMVGVKSGGTDMTASPPLNVLCWPHEEKMDLLLMQFRSCQQLEGILSSFVFHFLSLETHFYPYSALSLSWVSYANISVHYVNVASNRYANVSIYLSKRGKGCTQWPILSIFDFLFFLPVFSFHFLISVSPDWFIHLSSLLPIWAGKVFLSKV